MRRSRFAMVFYLFVFPFLLLLTRERVPWARLLVTVHSPFCFHALTEGRASVKVIDTCAIPLAAATCVQGRQSTNGKRDRQADLGGRQKF